MKVLILVLSARRAPWCDLMDCSIATWDAENHPQTQTLYYCGAYPELPAENELEPLRKIIVTGKVFFSPTLTESLEDVSPRTIEAFEKALELEWDFLARPHSSTYVHKGNLVRHLETLPTKRLLSGLMVGGPDPFIWGGGHFIFSRDVIEAFVEHKAEWRHDLMEDQSISRMAELLNILVHPGVTATINQHPDGTFDCLTYNLGTGFDFVDFADVAEKAKGHFFYRCKQDLRRHEDVRIMRELRRHLL